MPVRAVNKSNKQSDIVPHSFVHCIGGSKGLDLETVLPSVKDLGLPD